MISPETIEEIRQKADIVQIISSYIKVIKKGSDYVAICPFHADTNPSMHISPSKQIYKCFVCGKGGNVFNFVSEYEKISYIDAVVKVAEMIGFSGIEYKKVTRVVDDKTKNVLNALKEAKNLYKYLLKSQDGEKCYYYLKDRNISVEMQDYFELGYSSASPEITIKLLRSKGIEVEDLEDAGILARFNGQFVDKYSGRLIFPIYNEYSEVIGFSARVLEKNDQAKYINTKETVVFNKSQVLYNYQNAKNEAKKEGYVYVTEGFMDVFALYKAGIKSSVALMGTAFTQYHAKMLRKLNVEVRLCLDGDNAGQHGMLAASEILEKENIRYRIVDYKDVVLDPDEILQQLGENKLKTIVNQLIERNQFVFSYNVKRADLSTADGKKKFAESMIPFISSIDNPLDRDMIIKDVCFKTGISELTYVSLLNGNNQKMEQKNRKTNESYSNIPQMISKPMQKRKIDKVQDNILYQLLCFKEAVRDMEESGSYFINEIYERIRNYIVEGFQNNENFTTGELISNLSQSGDSKSSQMIDTITSIVQKDNRKTYDKQEMMEYLNVLNQEIKKKQEEDFKNSLLSKSPEEQAMLYKLHHDKEKGAK